MFLIPKHVMLDTGLWIRDEKNFIFKFIQHRGSSIQYHFGSSNGVFLQLLVGLPVPGPYGPGRRSFARIEASLYS